MGNHSLDEVVAIQHSHHLTPNFLDSSHRGTTFSSRHIQQIKGLPYGIVTNKPFVHCHSNCPVIQQW